MNIPSGGPYYFSNITHSDGTNPRMSTWRYAYENGPSEKKWKDTPTQATGRPTDDHRTALEIIRDNPILIRLHKTLPYEILDNLMRQVGDWSQENLDTESRADAMYNLARVANYIDHHINPANEDDRYENVISGFRDDPGFGVPGGPSYPYDPENLPGNFTKEVSARNYTTSPHSEAQLLERFGIEGYSAFKQDD